MIAFILYVLAAFGFAFIVGFAKVSLPFRSWLASPIKTVKFRPDWPEGGPFKINEEWHERPRLNGWATWIVALLECPACLGFWLGVFAALADRWFGFIALAGLTDAPRLFSIIFLGCVVSASNFILGVFTRLIEVR